MIEQVLAAIKIPVLFGFFISYAFFSYKFDRFERRTGIKPDFFNLKDQLIKTDDPTVKSKIECIIVLKKWFFLPAFFGIIFFIY